MRPSDIIANYGRAADELVALYEGVTTELVYGEALDHWPPAPARAIDIGAGTGRDAAWLAHRGYEVTAVEPSQLRQAGQNLHSTSAIEWIDDQLPGLTRLDAHARRFDLVLCNAVWQHIAPGDRPQAMQALARLTAPGGRLCLSLRSGPAHPDRPAHPTDPEESLAQAEALGLQLIWRGERDAIKPQDKGAGVTWIWLVLEKAAKTSEK